MVTIEKEKDIVAIVEKTIERLNIVKENAQKETKQIVIELARDLEGIISMDSICTEIISRLNGYLSPRTIRKYLDEKYKIKARVQNARKQKNKISSLAAQGPLNNGFGRLVVNDRNDISFPDGNNEQSFPPKESSDVDWIAIQSLSQKESLDSIEQNQSSIGQVKIGITECYGCIDKEERIKELEEAHQKVQQFTTAYKMGPSAVAAVGLKEEPEEPIEFEVSKTGSELRDFLISNNIRSTKDTIWFSGRIDRNSGKIVYFGLGRLDQSHQSLLR